MLKESSNSIQIYYPPFDRQQLIRRLKEELKALVEKLPILLVVLFGSYAKGNYTVASDVDLLIVHKDEARQDIFAAIKKTLSIPRIEPHVYSESEYKELKHSICKMAENGVVIFSKEKEL